MKSFIAQGELVGLRLDEAVFKSGFTLSRSKASALIKAGKVTVNGAIEKAHYPLEENDLVEVGEAEESKPVLQGEDIPLDVVYEDDDILVLNKPAGLVVHPGNGNPTGTLLHALIHAGIKLSGGDASRPGIVHRIDKDTSGLLCVAKTEEAFLSLSKQLSDHSMNRRYKALVLGVIPEDDGKIDAPIARSKKQPMKYCVDLKGKESVTFFHVEQRFRESGVSLVSCRLLTGRTHQIRVHMEYIGHPVLGDPLYGAGNRKIYDKGQLLHAYELTLTHPKTGERMTFSCSLPPHFLEVLGQLK
ncbi:MAG: RluA family pseudouridine synthase [Bacilli bacterium]|nr:RluA family pseudouridine synthase [Bacilli bacterium]